MGKIKFIKLTDLLQRYFLKYQAQYGKDALIAYLEGYIRGLKRK